MFYDQNLFKRSYYFNFKQLLDPCMIILYFKNGRESVICKFDTAFVGHDKFSGRLGVKSKSNVHSGRLDRQTARIVRSRTREGIYKISTQCIDEN